MSLMSKPFLKKFAGLTLALIMVFSVGYTYAATTIYPANFTDPVYTSVTSGSVNSTLWHSGANNVTDLMNYPQGSYSYLIFTDGVTVYAKNGTTGKIDNSSTTDAAVVINYAISNLPTASAGRIFICGGSYSLLTTVNITKSLLLEGIVPQIGVGGTNYGTELNGNGIDLISITPNIYNIALKNLYLNDTITASGACINITGYNAFITLEGITTDYGKYGLFINNTHQSSIRDSYSYRADYDVYINNTGTLTVDKLECNSALTAGVYLEKTTGSTFTDLIMESNNGHGLWIRGGSNLVFIEPYFEVNSLTNTSFNDIRTEISPDNEVDNRALTFINLGISDDNAACEVYLDRTYTTTFINFRVLNGVNVTLVGVQTINFIGGEIYPSAILTGTTSAISFLKVTGYVTENSGSLVNTTATTFVILHGLAGTSTGFWASFNDTGITGYSWANTNATAITVTIQGAPAGATPFCYWNAVYKP